MDDERASPAPEKKKTGLDEWLGPEEAQCQEEQGGTVHEVAQYFTEKAATRETKPLLWWKMNINRFPRLGTPRFVAAISSPSISLPSISLQRHFAVYHFVGRTLRRLPFRRGDASSPAVS